LSKVLGQPEEIFETTLNHLIKQHLLANAHVKIGRGIGDIIGADPAIAHVAPTFWGLTISAHLDNAQLLAFKFFDPRSGTMTIEHLLSQAEAHGEIFQHATPAQVKEVIRIARTQIVNLDQTLKLIRQKRNRLIAHLDPTVVRDPAKIAAQTRVTFSDLNRILGTAGDILNEVSAKFRNTTAVFDLVDEADYESLIGLIAEPSVRRSRNTKQNSALGSTTLPDAKAGRLPCGASSRESEANRLMRQSR
jgi:hypothetical protein